MVHLLLMLCVWTVEVIVIVGWMLVLAIALVSCSWDGPSFGLLSLDAGSVESASGSVSFNPGGLSDQLAR